MFESILKWLVGDIDDYLEKNRLVTIIILVVLFVLKRLNIGDSQIEKRIPKVGK